MDSLYGKVAVVTGAASGIGYALSQALIAERVQVVMVDIDPARLTAAANAVASDSDVSPLTIRADVSSFDEVQAVAEQVQARWHGVDLLFNNAGVQRLGRLWKIQPQDFEWLLRVNLLGAFHGIRAFVPAMIQRGEPAHVVNTASVSGLLGFARIGAYAATKFAIVGLSESLRLDLRERDAPIGVSVLCPGAVATGLSANSTALRGGEAAAGSADGEGTNPAEVATAVLDAVRADRFWILTHPGYNDLLARRIDWMLGRGEAPSAPGFLL